MKQRKDLFFVGLHTMIPLGMGTGIYTLVRPNTYISKLCIQWNPWLKQFRRPGVEKAGLVSVFLKNYACDMLWAYALAIGLLWYGRITGQKRWQSVMISIGFAMLMEGLQILPTVPGTFDVFDMVAEVLAILIAGCVSVIFYNYKDKKRGESL